jgi:hypothetical protein
LTPGVAARGPAAKKNRQGFEPGGLGFDRIWLRAPFDSFRQGQEKAVKVEEEAGRASHGRNVLDDPRAMQTVMQTTGRAH